MTISAKGFGSRCRNPTVQNNFKIILFENSQFLNGYINAEGQITSKWPWNSLKSHNFSLDLTALLTVQWEAQSLISNKYQSPNCGMLSNLKKIIAKRITFPVRADIHQQMWLFFVAHKWIIKYRFHAWSEQERRKKQHRQAGTMLQNHDSLFKKVSHINVSAKVTVAVLISFVLFFSRSLIFLEWTLFFWCYSNVSERTRTFSLLWIKYLNQN